MTILLLISLSKICHLTHQITITGCPLQVSNAYNEHELTNILDGWSIVVDQNDFLIRNVTCDGDLISGLLMYIHILMYCRNAPSYQFWIWIS